MYEETARAAGKKAIVIGAGIGGLCAAIALQNDGWEVVVVDKAPSLAEMGAGIVLAANALKVLDKLGVGKYVREEGSPVGKAEIRSWDGKLLVDLPTFKETERYGTPSYLIHRTALQSILYKQAASEAKIQFAKKLLAWEDSETKVTALFEDGTREEGDILIGADGIHSVVRDQLFGSAPLRYSGFTALRGIARFEDEHYTKELGGGFETWGAGKRFGFSHLGQDRVFWFAALNAPQDSLLPYGKRKQHVLQTFRGWHKPIEAVIDATEESAILAHDIFDRKPLRSWSKGRVTLLGDAAHPMQPNLGQGGAQAMEDAIVLAACFRNTPEPQAALLAYEQQRIKRTSLIVRRSRRMGRMVQLENPFIISGRNLILRAIPARIQLHSLDWLIGFEA
jgi:2-polyprenyl-6-methoxyphenol hydroxylase-like FAD-dependent oxidoreductase